MGLPSLSFFFDDRNALSARGDGGPPRRFRSSSPFAACDAGLVPSSAGSSVCGYVPTNDSETPEEIQNEALFRACRVYGLGEQFLAAAQDEAPSASGPTSCRSFEVAAATARLLKHHTRSGAWVEITPGLKVPHTHSTQHTQALLQHTHRMVAHRLRLAGRMAGVSGSSLGDPAPQRTASQ